MDRKLRRAIKFHRTYEELAPKYGYETREDTKEFDENSKNGKLMLEVCDKVVTSEIDIYKNNLIKYIKDSLFIHEDVKSTIIDSIEYFN